MGTIYKISCKCGYNKKLYLGVGLSSCSISLAERLFSEEKLKRFKDDFEDKKVRRFTIENVAAFCEECKEIEQVYKLEAELINGDKYNLISECPICNGKVKILDKNYKCPVCKKNMDIISEGIWD